MSSDGGEAIRQVLEAEKERLGALLSSDEATAMSSEVETASAGELSDRDQHPAEMATETQEREREEGLIDSIEGALDDVEGALVRLDEGTYGTCVACGKPIPPERLEALPATPYCIGDAELTAAEAAPGVAPVNPEMGGRR